MSSQQRGADRRDVIIDACLDLLLEVGPDSLTHRMIAERADVPLGSTTYYFSSLEELVQEALHKGASDTERALEDLDKRLLDGEDLPAIIVSTFEEYLADKDQLLIWGELFTVASHQPEFRPLVDLWRDGMTKILGRHLPLEKAHMLAIFLDGVLLHALIDDDLPDREILLRTIRLNIG